ncbi:MAG: FxsA family protein [Pelagibacteraceae bacterium]
MQFTILFLIFVPLIEIYLMIKIGAVIGAFNTIMATLLTAVIGLYFVKLQGISTLYSAAQAIRKDQAPLKELLGGFCLIIAAIFLIIPGFATDFVGFLLLIPFTRQIILKLFLDEEQINNKTYQSYKTIDIEPEEINEHDK